MESNELAKGLQDYVEHLRRLADTFNTCSSHAGLHVRMDPARAIRATEDGIGIARVAPFWSRVDDSGIVHETQLKTAIDCFVHLLKDPKRCGHVLGAMQSGKTTTSLALQWAGPILYMLTGMRVYPFYIIGNQTTYEDQTNTELDRFIAYYGNVELYRTEGAQEAPAEAVDAMFAHSPSLATYRGHVLRDPQDVYSVPKLEDIVLRRVGGDQSVRKIVELCRRAAEQGYRPLMIIDEPQFGASDRMVQDDSGQTVRRRCVLVQMFDRIEQALGSTRDDHWFVGLSATPFELNDLEQVWEVRQSLSANYSGFNFFNKRAISDDVEITPPTTLSLSRFADFIDIPFLKDVSMAAYSGKQTAFVRYARKIGYDGDQAEFQTETQDALREAIYAMLEEYSDDPEPVGFCIRAFNNNGETEALIQSLALDTNVVEVLPYFGPPSKGISVKRAIARRSHPELPYVVFVTNRARMADAFPTSVRFFLDFAQKASDLNALLQGLLGRACGYNKRSTVVLSDANESIVNAYIATVGGYVHRTSRHSVAVGGARRSTQIGMLKVRLEMEDPVVRKFFQEIDQQVVRPNLKNPKQLKTARAREGYRTGPILRIAEQLDLFAHLESSVVRTQLFPNIPNGFNVARRGDEIRHSRAPDVILRYSVNENGDCRYTFRWSERDAAATGGAAGRAKGQKDVGQHVEPTIYVEKVDPVSGDVIPDRLEDAAKQREGVWRAFMVTFPLREPARDIQPAEVAYPIDLSPYDNWMTTPEREKRDEGARRGTTRHGHDD